MVGLRMIPHPAEEGDRIVNTALVYTVLMTILGATMVGSTSWATFILLKDRGTLHWSLKLTYVVVVAVVWVLGYTFKTCFREAF